MNKIRRFTLGAILAALVVTGVLGLANAQTDPTPTPSIQCDSELILDLYIAQHFFGLSQIREQVLAMGGDAATMVDINTLDRGQYTPWFGFSTVSSLNPLTPDQTEAIATLLLLDDATLESTLNAGTDMSGMSVLPSVTIEGEAPECTQLRAELNRFFRVVAFQSITSGLGGALATPSAPEATP